MEAITKAMVLAAGQGKRMRPITDNLPKPLVSVCGVTLLDRILDKLVAAGIQEVVVNGHYLADILETHVKGRQQPHILFSREEEVLETGGGVAKALPLLGNAPFFIINGDVLWLDGGEPVLAWMVKAWDAAKMDGLLLLHPRERAIGYDGEGDFNLGVDGALVRTENGPRPYVFAGISIMHPRLFTDLPPAPFSLNQLYWRAKQQDGALSRFYGIAHQGEWLHIGTPEGLQEAEVFLSETPL